ncbi:hypothetical protein VN97_g8617 [Penicillium thymicola]|uniref:Uncharacterized protein n=1 Tax=Penicillium thymicola TaxID=293382 RepID=A0AAI9TCJ1_PENTH|nr:hypothetical protein VN97_g8617 [Penicillium thymicola]
MISMVTGFAQKIGAAGGFPGQVKKKKQKHTGGCRPGEKLVRAALASRDREASHDQAAELFSILPELSAHGDA